MVPAAYSITGLNPMLGLGNIGLGGFGGYSSYDQYMPYSMGMNGSLFNGYGLGYGSGMGMYGMYNPKYMIDMQQQIEQNQLLHGVNMHGLVKDMEVTNQRKSDNALIEKILTNGDVQTCVKNLYYKVQSGDQDGVCQEFDKLKNRIYERYRDELIGMGDEINPEKSVGEIIKRLYEQLVGSDLETDIKTYGEGALENGFKQGLNTGHSESYVDETINHCFGRRIEDKGSQDFQQTMGQGLGYTARFVKKGAIGAGVTATAYGLGTGLIKGCGALVGKGDVIKFNQKWLKVGGKFAFVGALAAAIGDVVWKCTKD